MINLALCLLIGVVVGIPVVWGAATPRHGHNGGDGHGGGADSGAAAVTPKQLGGNERYLTHLSTDKPVYKPGETVYVRGVLLHADTHKPLPSNGRYFASIKIKGPKGETVASGHARGQDSVAGFSWKVPDDQAGGEHKLVVEYPHHGYAPATRSFDVRVYRAPRLKNQIVFLRDGYGPGDRVVASLETKRAEGGVPAGAEVTLIARVDGAVAYRGRTKVSAEGLCEARFNLPAKIARGEGTIAFVIKDGGVVETASKTIPILLQTVDLKLYPEGGDLVAGLSGRVYMEARTPYGKPADLTGEVIDSKGQVVGAFRTEHEGRGRFDIKPKLGGRYALRITKPAGITRTFALPEVKASGVSLTAVKDTFTADEPIALRVNSNVGGAFKVTLRKRERELTAQDVAFTVAAGEKGNPVTGKPTTVNLTPKDGASGVLIATVWNEDGKPMAERLIFRKPAGGINVSITPDASTYVPGGRVNLSVKTTNDKGEPVAAVVGVTVTDDSVLEMIEKREQAPRLPVMVMLEPEVKELADAHVYLDSANEEAPLAVDLLLGTQGWRRFALVNTASFLATHGDAGRRMLAMRVVTEVEIREELKKVRKLHRRGAVALGGVPVPGNAAPVEAAAVLEGAAVDPAANANKGGVEAPDLAKAPQQGGQQAQQQGQRGDGQPANPQGQGQGAADGKAQQVADDKPANRPEPAPAHAGKPAVAIAPKRPVADKELADALDARRRLDRDADLFAGGREANARYHPTAFAFVRQYAHKLRPNYRPGQRIDFTETLYWHAGVKTVAKTGLATVSFSLNDSVTSFKVLADAFDQNGMLGSGTGQVESVEPFYMEPKLPLEVTMGDQIRLPLAMVNGTDEKLSGSLEMSAPRGITIDDVSGKLFTLDAKQRARQIIAMKIGQLAGAQPITIGAQTGAYGDRVTRTLMVKPLGFPNEIGRGGLLAPNNTFTYRVTIPKDVVPLSVRSEIMVYPSPLANMTESLKRLIREPNGCFEQTSSSTYPLVMAQQYFMSHAGVDPKLIEKSNSLLEKGYKRLIGFECKQGGYEWFGADPGHEALTAYGLLEFTDMAKVRNVDTAMLARTRKWLAAQRDGNGGFARKRRALHTWITDPDCSNGYITWALLEAGESPEGLFSEEVASFKHNAGKSSNSYVIALGALVAAKSGDSKTAAALMSTLSTRLHADGFVDGATTSIVGSGGEALKIEATALAALAWMTDKRYTGQVEKAMRWLAESCKNGRYGSTQSTVLALRAIVTYDSLRAKANRKAGKVQVLVDGKPMGDPVPFDADAKQAIAMTDVSEMMFPGEHKIELRMTDGFEMPFALALTYNRTMPASAEKCSVNLSVKLRDIRLTEGAVTEAVVAVTNKTDKAAPNPVAIIGVPGGLEVRHDQLKELVKAKRIAAYEVRGREVILYWRAMEPEQRIELPISFVAAVPGVYTAPASRAYLYYTDEHKHWVSPMTVDIAARTR